MKSSKENTLPAAFAAAVAMLARRDHCSSEVHAKLERQGFDVNLIETVLAELIEKRALNDARYAENYVSYHAGRGRGPLRIAADLRALGMPGELIEGALADGRDWLVLARQVKTRKFGADEPATWAEKARQARFLQFRGFSADQIRAALGPDFDPE